MAASCRNDLRHQWTNVARNIATSSSSFLGFVRQGHLPFFSLLPMGIYFQLVIPREPTIRNSAGHRLSMIILNEILHYGQA